jgi:hypothetical protein
VRGKKMDKEVNKLLGNAIRELFKMIRENPQKLLNPPPSLMAAGEYLKLYLFTEKEPIKTKYLENLSDVLMKFRVVCSDYRFSKILREIGIPKKFATQLMAVRLGFEPGQEKCNG